MSLLVEGDMIDREERYICNQQRRLYEYAFTQYGTDYTISDIGTHEYLYAYDKNNRLITETEHISGIGDDYTGILEITKQNEYDNDDR